MIVNLEPVSGIVSDTKSIWFYSYYSPMPISDKLREYWLGKSEGIYRFDQLIGDYPIVVIIKDKRPCSPIGRGS